MEVTFFCPTVEIKAGLNSLGFRSRSIPAIACIGDLSLLDFAFVLVLTTNCGYSPNGSFQDLFSKASIEYGGGEKFHFCVGFACLRQTDVLYFSRNTDGGFLVQEMLAKR
jgi:hypothetical protein